MFRVFAKIEEFVDVEFVDGDCIPGSPAIKESFKLIILTLLSVHKISVRSNRGEASSSCQGGYLGRD